jgi:hypothetical protein
MGSDRRLSGSGRATAAAAVATNIRRTNMHFSNVGGERDEHSDPGKWDKICGLHCGDFHERLPDASDARAEASPTPSMYFL